MSANGLRHGHEPPVTHAAVNSPFLLPRHPVVVVCVGPVCIVECGPVFVRFRARARACVCAGLWAAALHSVLRARYRRCDGVVPHACRYVNRDRVRADQRLRMTGEGDSALTNPNIQLRRR